MVLDTSALLGILLDEPGAEELREAVESDPVRLLSAASLLETAIVISARYGDAGERELDLLLYKASLQIVSVDADQVEIARSAYRRFGKGRHAAGLNFGDCFAYALSKVSGEPLLLKGKDFGHTDVARVL